MAKSITTFNWFCKRKIYFRALASSVIAICYFVGSCRFPFIWVATDLSLAPGCTAGPVLRIKWVVNSTDISFTLYSGFGEVLLSFSSFSRMESCDYYHHLPLICSYD